MKNIKKVLLVVWILLIAGSNIINAQPLTVKEDTYSVNTYDFSEPNPVPLLADNPKIYPYYKFEGYEHKASKKDWKVVTLENDYIKVFVLPGMGGKVWGAIEKSTGEEFIYKNEVMKFRNLSLRGPWTSGGVEFNFGIIGHSPDTSTPVDYKLLNNDDGSVSCVVGTMDLTSRTRWWVEIKLEKDKAYFETRASWYNSTPLNQSYYNWMTAAAAVTDDLEFIYPGNQYLEHSGEAKVWPVDAEGRNLAMYRENSFGSAKSRHVVGDYRDFFGGYYHNKKFGFGHWAPYEEMPGQKLWLWSLSRFGGIWEDLLTDTDGQYMEFQAGRLFNQYSPGAVNPISQANFEPHVMDRWRELWFPFKEIGGMVDASEYGVLNVKEENGELYVGVNALQPLNKTLRVLVNGSEIYSEQLDLETIDVFSTTIATTRSDKVEVIIDDADLYYQNDPERTLLKRPFAPDANAAISASEQLYYEAWEAMKFREIDRALGKLTQLLELDPYHRAGLVKMAELEFGRTNYDAAVDCANRVLALDTYDPGANYFAGISYRALDDDINALESLGWAARDLKYKTVSYAQMAEIYLHQHNLGKASIYAQKALDFNAYNLNARQVLAVVSRKQADEQSHSEQVEDILKIDPLNHFADMERGLMKNGETGNSDLIKGIHNEFVAETVLELALRYYNLGLSNEAIRVLSFRSSDTKNKLWLAYCLRNSDKDKSAALLKETVGASIEFVFPYRRETLPVLEWAVDLNDHWKLNYLLALNYLAVNLDEKGEELIKELGDQPDINSFYRFRAKTLRNESYAATLHDYQRALTLGEQDWKAWEEFIQFHLRNKKFDAAYQLSEQGAKKFPDNYNIGLAYSEALLNVGAYKKVIDVLRDIQLLPYEHARESRQVYEKAHIALAQEYMQKKSYKKAIKVLEESKKWPENIGVGKPYNPDERPQDYLLALAYLGLNNQEKAAAYLEDVVEYTHSNMSISSVNHLFGLYALEELNRSEELNELLESLRNNPEDQRSRDELAYALFENDSNRLAELKKMQIVDEVSWKLMEAFASL